MSSIWNHYEKLPGTSGMAKCVLCKKDYSYKTSTTNLKKHLNYKHSIPSQSGSVSEKQPVATPAGSSSPQNKGLVSPLSVTVENRQVLDEVTVAAIAGDSSGIGQQVSGLTKHAAPPCKSCSFPNQNTEADECHQREVPVTRRRYPYNKSKAQKRKSNDTTDLQEVQENMANAITIINRIIKDQQKHNNVEEDEIDLYGKLLVKRLRLLSQRESQELMYEIDGMVLNRLHNQKDPMSFNNEESVSPPPASPVTIRVVKRSVSPCSPYTTPAASPCSP